MTDGRVLNDLDVQSYDALFGGALTESLSAALRATLTPETRARATTVAGTIRTDGATVAASSRIPRPCATWCRN